MARGVPGSRWVRFTAPFDWSPPERQAVTLAYPAGHVDRVPGAYATAAIAAGRAVRVSAPRSAAAAKALRQSGAPTRSS